MMLQNLRARIGARLNGDREAGFTLIELLVVMLILGILAAIALPAFFNQKEKAGDSKAKENAHTAQVAMETYATENGGSYTGVTMEKLHKIEPTISATEAAAEKPGLRISTTASNKYKIESESTNLHTFSIENNAGELTYPCTPKESGGCPSTEKWNE